MTDVGQSTPQTGTTVIVERSDLDSLLAAIAGQGYHVVGPTVRDGAIVYGDVRSSADLPVGWSDEQDGGSYRLRRRDDQAVFGYAVGPQSWKQFLHPPQLRLWRARRGENGEGIEILEEPTPSPRFAFIGVRSCELHAIAIQDQVFLPGATSGPELRGPARGRPARGGQLRRAGGPMLLCLDEHRPEGELGARPCADRGARRRPSSVRGRDRE